MIKTQEYTGLKPIDQGWWNILKCIRKSIFIYLYIYVHLPVVLLESGPAANVSSNFPPVLSRAKNRSTRLSSGWTTLRPASTSGSVLWSTTLSLGWEDQYRRILPDLDSYAWGHASDTGERRMHWGFVQGDACSPLSHLFAPNAECKVEFFWMKVIFFLLPTNPQEHI